MNESDWKIFTQIKDKAIDLFCNRALLDYEKIIKNDNEDVHERYLQLYSLVQKRNKRMASLFDGHSRSGALLQLLSIRAEGLADENLLNKLSEEFLLDTDPKRLKY